MVMEEPLCGITIKSFPLLVFCLLFILIIELLLLKFFNRKAQLHRNFLGDGLANNGNSNPLCGKYDLEIGEIRSFYCDMFGRYVNIIRAGLMYLAEVIVNPETTGSSKYTGNQRNRLETQARADTSQRHVSCADTPLKQTPP